MLRRGPLRRQYGEDVCDRLIAVAASVPPLAPPQAHWLDLLAPISDIDPGEAQIFAVAAESGCYLVTGDQRALRALGRVVGYPEALSGRVIVLEAMLIALCRLLGSHVVRARVAPLAPADALIRMCFSEQPGDPLEHLRSYCNRLASEVNPMALWSPLEDPRQ